MPIDQVSAIASESPCEVWRVTNCDLYCICICTGDLW